MSIQEENRSRSRVERGRRPARGPTVARVHDEVEKVLHLGGTVAIASFRCPIEHAMFGDTGPVENDLIAFPRSSVWIRQDGGRPFLADPGLATIYNRGQRYWRGANSPDGDRCEWFAVSREMAREIAEASDPSAAERPDRPFRDAFAPVSAALYLRQRLLVARLRGGEPLEELEVEEEAVAVVHGTLAAAAALRSSGEPRPARAALLSLAERARELLASQFAEPWTLGDLARRLAASPFHLCRSFRRAFGTTLHRHRSELRLRAALTPLARRETDLAELAFDLGYSSHAHFSAAFKKLYGHSPSAVRAMLAGRSARLGLERRPGRVDPARRAR